MVGRSSSRREPAQRRPTQHRTSTAGPSRGPPGCFPFPARGRAGMSLGSRPANLRDPPPATSCAAARCLARGIIASGRGAAVPAAGRRHRVSSRRWWRTAASSTSPPALAMVSGVDSWQRGVDDYWGKHRRSGRGRSPKTPVGPLRQTRRSARREQRRQSLGRRIQISERFHQ